LYGEKILPPPVNCPRPTVVITTGRFGHALARKIGLEKNLRLENDDPNRVRVIVTGRPEHLSSLRNAKRDDEGFIKSPRDGTKIPPCAEFISFNELPDHVNENTLAFAFPVTHEVEDELSMMLDPFRRRGGFPGLFVMGTKGLGSRGELMCDLLYREYRDVVPLDRQGTGGGPNIAGALQFEHWGFFTLAFEDKTVAAKAASFLESNHFCINITTDRRGLSIAGAIKNLLGTGVGILLGLREGIRGQHPDKSAQYWKDLDKRFFIPSIARCATEFKTLGRALGAKIYTMDGHGGLSDLIATGVHSRTGTLGRNFGMIGNFQEAIDLMSGQTLEGYNSRLEYMRLAEKNGVHLGTGLPMTSFLLQTMAPAEFKERYNTHDPYNVEDLYSLWGALSCVQRQPILLPPSIPPESLSTKDLEDAIGKRSILEAILRGDSNRRTLRDNLTDVMRTAVTLARYIEHRFSSNTLAALVGGATTQLRDIGIQVGTSRPNIYTSEGLGRIFSRAYLEDLPPGNLGDRIRDYQDKHQLREIMLIGLEIAQMEGVRLPLVEAMTNILEGKNPEDQLRNSLWTSGQEEAPPLQPNLEFTLEELQIAWVENQRRKLIEQPELA